MKNSTADKEKPKEKNGQQVFDLDPTECTSVINGNNVLFLGLGARKITMETNKDNNEM